jgi:hypothetical protein
METAGIEPASAESDGDSEGESDLAGPDAGQIASESSHEVASTDDDPLASAARRNYLRLRYVKAMRELGPSKLFGFVDAKPLRPPQPAEKAASYLSKYLAKWNEDGSFEVTETVKAAGRSLLNYVSRRLTAKSGVTMRVLRQVRIAWAWREGLLPDEVLDGFELLIALCLLEQVAQGVRAP